MSLNSQTLFGICLSVVVASFSMLQAGSSYADSSADIVAEGMEIAVDRQKGNCLACHIMGDGEFPGTMGPPLIFMQQRFPDKAILRARIYDATAANPNSMMPPFGRHGILTEEEVDKITEYIYTL